MTRFTRRSALITAAVLAAVFVPAFRAQAVDGQMVSARLEAESTDASRLADRDFVSAFELFYAGPQWFRNALPGSRARAMQVFADSSSDRSMVEADYIGTLPNVFTFRTFDAAAPFSHDVRPMASGLRPVVSAPSLVLANTANIFIGAPGSSLETPTNWSLGHVPTVFEDAVFSTFGGTSGGIVTALTVGSFNATALGSFSIFDPGVSNSTLVLGGVGNTGNSVSGNPGDLLYAAVGSSLNIIGHQGIGTGFLSVLLGQTGNFDAAGQMDISAAITDGGGGFGINKTGGGFLLLSGANTYTGDTTIKAGELFLTASGSLAGTSTIRLGDTVPNSPSAQFTFGSNNGGVTLSNPLIVQASASGTQGTRTLLGVADSGNTNTYSGLITMNADLVLQSAAVGGSVTNGQGILLLQGGSIDVGTSTLTVNSNLRGNNADTYSIQGIVRINEALTTTHTTGGSIVKDGSGTLIIQSTGNNYTGTDPSALNSNGTRIGGGVLAIYGDTSLGMAPTSATNNVFFIPPGTNVNGDSISPTLRADAAGITLAATRNLNIANTVTARFDSNGNTFTIAGNINGGGNLAKVGPGTLVLTGANTYTGTTTINAGTLNAAAPNALGSTTSVSVNSGGTLLFSNSGTTDRVNDSAGVKLNANGSPTVAIDTGGLSEHGAANNDAGLGALTLASSSIIDMGNGASILAFANSLLQSPNWSGTLSIYNWSGTPLTGGGLDQLFFGNNSSGLSLAQLADFQFYSGAGTGAYTPGAIILSDGEVVPLTAVPEPSTWIGAALALAAIGFSQRQRVRRLLARA